MINRNSQNHKKTHELMHLIAVSLHILAAVKSHVQPNVGHAMGVHRFQLTQATFERSYW